MKLIFAQKNFALLSAAICFANCFAARGNSDAAGIEFFEREIRPILVDRCYKCHSREAEKTKGGLLLDTREGLLKGGETGPAIVPGDTEKSLLIKAVRYTSEDLQMPPKGKKLSAQQVASLETWVRMGAPDPQSEKLQTPSSKLQSSKNHWAFQPVRNPAIPEVKNKKWIRTPVDNFILAKLEEKNLKPSAQADKRTLIRRATLDLIGLPPTPEEVENFLADKSSDAFAKVIDRLLASPRYGERWGRYWLDVARYADTKGYVFEEERRYPFSFTYRDYVIRAFNEDLPYDQFLIQQVAADLLPLGEDKRPLAALGFLTLGRRFLNNASDIIDDRIDVLCRGTMALTVACARCHDHKFDPIPTKDYYSLYGVFASCTEPSEKPLLGNTDLPKEYNAYLAEHEKRKEALKNYRETKEKEMEAKLRASVGDYLLALHDAPPDSEKEKRSLFIQGRKLSGTVANRWQSDLETRAKKFDPIFAPWFEMSALNKEEFSAKAKILSDKFLKNSETTNSLNPLVAKLFTNAPATLEELSQRYNSLFAKIDQQWKGTLENAAKTNAPAGETTAARPPDKFSDEDKEALRQVIYAENSPPNLSKGEIHALFDTTTQVESRRLQREIEGLDAEHPGAPPRAMVLNDSTPYTPHVFIRGNAGNHGPEVPRQMLAIVTGEKREPFKNGSGRLELAQAIASKENPLTARVLVNRVWLHHFGKGLVNTPADFGVRSDPPTHPELLDYLAARFMEEGWSIKKLHRWMMLSSTYQQSSEASAETKSLANSKSKDQSLIASAAATDSENKLLWKMNRQRLDFEAMRDSLLFVSGRLDLAMGGRPVEITAPPFSSRRSVYGYIDRQNLPNLFRTFDFASPDSTSAQRYFTTVPQQALFLLNSPFVLEQARSMVHSNGFEKFPRNEKRIEFLYEKIFQRKPEKEELWLAEKIFQEQSHRPPPSEQPVWQYGYGLFDSATNRIKDFHAFGSFIANSWRHSSQFPDPTLGYAMLDIEGGHPGNHPQHAAVRRWISPFDGIVKIEGTLRHIFDRGDGVRGRIVSSRNGKLGEWIVFHNSTETTVELCAVKRGDTIDFVTDLRESSAHDTFKWAMTLRVLKVAYGTPPPPTEEWNSQKDFSGPKENFKPLEAWEKLAQVLLVSNEFFFVD